MTIKLFEFNRPKHGYYSVWYDREMKTYGITKAGWLPGVLMRVLQNCLD